MRRRERHGHVSQDRHTSLVDPHTFPATDAVFKERVGQILREIGKADPKSLVGAG